MEINTLTVGLVLAATVIAYHSSKAVYNLCFHPLREFPGPWWASVSYFAEFYYDAVRGGQYFKVVVQMHERYGPLVRINPDELHFNDPYFYDTIYAGSLKRRNKDKSHAAMAGLANATSVTIDHDLHRQRRGYIANLFSKRSILRLEGLIQAKVDKLVLKLRDAHANKDTLLSIKVFVALTADVITHYVYGESFNELDKPKFPCAIANDLKQLLLSIHFRRFLPIVAGAMKALPEPVLEWLNPALGTFFKLDHKVTALCAKALEKGSPDPQLGQERTIFDALTDASVPPQEKTLIRLKDESILVLFAGLDTNGRFLSAMLCYMLTYPAVLAKLRSELESAVQTLGKPLSWIQLEQLPYLTAFINESLRLNSSPTGRFPRVPLEPVAYKQWVIPAGASVGTMPWLLNHNSDVFPEPLAFRPERWLEAEARGENLTKYLMSFSKGTRGCLGINLAYAEIYLTIAALVQNFNMELVDSSVENLVAYRDFALAFDKDYNFGVKFKITEVLLA